MFFDEYHHMWGMHWGWWIFWVAFILIIVMMFWRGRAGSAPAPSRETPMETLQRRYAAGEITTEQYEERKTHLKRDRL